MAKARRRKQQPSSPEEITLRRIADRMRARAEERRAERDPSTWGIEPSSTKLDANRDLELTHDPHQRKQLVHVRRVGVFEAVTLSDDQHRAAQRYLRDWNLRAGVHLQDTGPSLVVDSSPGLAPGQHVTQIMIDAGARIEDAHGAVGRAAATLLQALVEPLVVHGRVRVWRVVVKEVTGETEPHAQGAAVRQACRALELAYADIDKKAAEEAKRRRYAGGSAVA